MQSESVALSYAEEYISLSSSIKIPSFTANNIGLCTVCILWVWAVLWFPTECLLLYEETLISYNYFIWYISH